MNWRNGEGYYDLTATEALTNVMNETKDPDEFDSVQLEIERRKALGRPTSCTNIFAAKVVCADCGGWYGKKVWGSYKGDKTYRKEVWQCNNKYKRQDRTHPKGV